MAEPSWGLESWPCFEDIPAVWSGNAIALYRDDAFEAPQRVYCPEWRSPWISAEVRERMERRLD